jgi:phage protein D
MATTKLFEESISQGAFYVPRYEVKILGANLPRDVLYDIISLTYEDSSDTIDSFKMTVNNWDDQTRKYKYIGSETSAQLEPSHPDYPRMTLFEPCGKDVTISMGYRDRLVQMLKGNFMTMQPQFNESNGTLNVTGLNVLHKLRRKQYSTTWTNKKDSEIAQNIATLTDGGQKRFPLPIVIDQNAMGLEKPIPIVSQHNQYDIEFLMQRARMRGYVVFIQEADPATGRQEQLYFGPSKPGMIPGLRDVTFELEWGKSIIDFTPTLTTANQIGSVTVRGWHRTRRQAISRTVTLDHPRIVANRDLHRILKACEAREELVVDEPVFTNCEALERAISILLDQTKLIVTATVRTVGLPDLRSGQIVVINGVGARLSGKYFIKKTTHTINDGGYITQFDCRREEFAPPPGGGASAP